MLNNQDILEHTQQWIETIVVGLNFCPFAKRELRKNAVRFVVNDTAELQETLQQLISECAFLDNNPETETTLIILASGFDDFMDYLDLIELAENLLAEQDYEGVYQVASFHPDYCFADADSEDAANYTNRSPYPMLHLLREASLDNAIDNFPDIDSIPETNMQKARSLGVQFFREFLNKQKL
ncbi:MAG TPA: DUF1415 domain-containing protein [Arenimonas sp.]|nr:DUF1415 domain-containing protein [Arenimonas sp.]